MRRQRRIGLIIGVAAALAACSPPAQQASAPPAGEPAADAAASDPSSVIRPLYERYRTDPAVTTFPALEEQAPWSDDLRAQLSDMIARSQAQNEPILDFDPFVGAQDWELQALNVANEAVAENSHAVVRASVTNAGFTEDILFDMIWQNGAWRVDNIRGRDWDLRQIIAA
ncbi:MAG: DUF3828 domain-containing protein [Hyphomonadaceae bacterium]